MCVQSHRQTLATTLVLLSMGVAACAKNPAWSAAERSKAAIVAEQTRKALSKLQNFEHTGFDGGTELLQSTLGEGIEEATLPADDVIGLSPPKALEPGSKLVFPLLLNDEVRAYIEVESLRSGAWHPIRFASSEAVQKAFEQRAELKSQGSSEFDRFYLVQSPAMNLVVLGVRKQGKEALLPLSKTDRHFNGATEPVPLADAVVMLRKYYLKQVLDGADLGPVRRHVLEGRLKRTPDIVVQPRRLQGPVPERVRVPSAGNQP